MKILVFGGVGFIGTNISLLALERGHSVVAFDNLSRPGVESNLGVLLGRDTFQFIQGDIRNKNDFFRLSGDIDCIVNLAANSSVPRSIIDPIFDFHVNVEGHLNVLEFSKNHGKIPVIFASSNKVYTDQINNYEIIEKEKRYLFADSKLKWGIDETHDVDGFEGFTNSPYGAGKLSAEKYTREYWVQYGIPMVINRMSCVYGLYQKGVEEQGWVDWFVRAKKFGLPVTIYGNGKQVRDVLFGTDIADVYLYEIEHIDMCSGHTFNIGGGPAEGFNVSLLELIEIIDMMFPGKKLQCTYKNWRSSDQRIYVSNIKRVQSVIPSWKPTTNIKDGLKKMWAAYGK